MSKITFVPPPIDGINRISDPATFGPREARELDNYYIYDWGIRERGALNYYTLTGGAPISMYSFASAGKYGTLMGSTNGHIYRYNAGDNSFTDLSGPGNSISQMFSYQKKVFMCDVATSAVSTYDLATDAYAATSFTGIGGDYPTFGFVHKNRVYLLFYGKSYFKYGPVGGVGGALSSSYDVGQFFQLPAQNLVWGAAWSFNEGVNNDTLFVVGNELGEVFIYHGEYPESASWTLDTKVNIPAPLMANYASNTSNCSILPIGQDIYINTARGAISLKQVLAGNKGSGEESYYTISRKIGYVLQRGLADRSTLYPFAYFVGGTGATYGQVIYVLNYERGAWSTFAGVTSSSNYILCNSCAAPPNGGAMSNPPSSYVLFGLTDGRIARINESDSTGEGVTYKWSTPFIDFGTSGNKQIASRVIRVVGRDMASNSIINSVSCTTDFNDSVAGAVSGGTKTVSDKGYKTQELAPAAVGRQISYTFSKTGSTSQQNEIAGFSVVYDEGGLQ